MVKSGEVGKNRAEIRKAPRRFVPDAFLLIALLLALLLGGVLGRQDTTTAIMVVGVFLLTVVVVLRQYELALTMIVAAHIYVDWYLGLEIVAPAAAIGLLCVLFLMHSKNGAWPLPRALWLWGLLLLLTIAPVIGGAQSHYDLAYYYPNIILGALVMFWLGLVVVSDSKRLHKLFNLLALFGALLALHTLIQGTTGIVIFGSTRFDAFLARVSGFELANSTVNRIGSFFINPDWNGTFFATMLLLPLGLFAESTALLSKLFYLVEMFLMLVALLFTYSSGAWIAAFVGILIFIVFVGHVRYRILMPLLIAIVAIAFTVLLPTEVNLLYQHTINPSEVSLRLGAWQTAIRVINAFPLSGVGFGLTNYLQRAEPYRVPAQYLPLAHPHNAYLELGAMGGLPTLLLFISLLLLALWLAWHNWRRSDARTRSLLGGGIAAIIALSVNSVSINGWTLPPLAMIGWLILGAMASPLLTKKLPSDNESEL